MLMCLSHVYFKRRMATIKPGALPGSYVFATLPGGKMGTHEMPVEAAAPSTATSFAFRQSGSLISKAKPRVLTSESPFYERSVKFSGYFKEGITESSVEVSEWPIVMAPITATYCSDVLCRCGGYAISFCNFTWEMKR
jgi:hypothetical protein